MSAIVSPPFSIASLVGQNVVCNSLIASTGNVIVRPLTNGGLDIQNSTGTVSYGFFKNNGVILLANSFIGFSSSSGDANVGADARLLRDAADTLAQRNGVNAQTFRVYNTYTDASNYERAGITWNSSTLEIATAAAGTGTVRDIRIIRGGTTLLRLTSSVVETGANLTFASDNAYDIGASGATRPRTVYVGTSLNLGGVSNIQAVSGTVYITGAAETPSGGSSYIKATNANPLAIGTNNTDRWQFSTAGHFLAAADNAYDIGANGANRPRRGYFGSDVRAPIFYVGASQTSIEAPSDGVLKVTNAAGTDFSRLQFGGTTSAFPALKRVGADLDVRLADDTGFAVLQAKLTTDTNYTAGVIVPTGYLTLYDATGTAYRVPCVV